MKMRNLGQTLATAVSRFCYWMSLIYTWQAESKSTFWWFGDKSSKIDGQMLGSASIFLWVLFLFRLLLPCFLLFFRFFQLWYIVSWQCPEMVRKLLTHLATAIKDQSTKTDYTKSSMFERMFTVDVLFVKGWLNIWVGCLHTALFGLENVMGLVNFIV